MKRLFVVLLLLCTFAEASKKMTVVGQVTGRQIVMVSPGESRWDPAELLSTAVTVVGFEHANGELQNLRLCGAEMRFRLFTDYQLELEYDEQENIGESMRTVRRGTCWVVTTTKKVKR